MIVVCGLSQTLAVVEDEGRVLIVLVGRTLWLVLGVVKRREAELKESACWRSKEYEFMVVEIRVKVCWGERGGGQLAYIQPSYRAVDSGQGSFVGHNVKGRESLAIGK